MNEKQYTLEEFEWVWKDSSVYDILNQFYYEHNDLRELLKENDNKEEVIKKQQETIDKAIEYNKEIVDNYLEEDDCEYCDGRYATAKHNLNILQNGSDDNE